MNSYEIEIYNIKDDAEMNVIQHALHDGGITDAGDQESGPYLQFGHARSVFVALDEVAKTVEILNSLGYETDEDELEHEDSPEDY